ARDNEPPEYANRGAQADERTEPLAPGDGNDDGAKHDKSPDQPGPAHVVDQLEGLIAGSILPAGAAGRTGATARWLVRRARRRRRIMLGQVVQDDAVAGIIGAGRS